MRYFVRVRDNPEAENYGQPMALFRFDGEAGVAEAWTDDSWQFNPNVLDAFGGGGTTDFREVPEADADAFINRGGPGSGHFGHEGRPGERGGSAPSAGGAARPRLDRSTGITAGHLYVQPGTSEAVADELQARFGQGLRDFEGAFGHIPDVAFTNDAAEVMDMATVRGKQYRNASLLTEQAAALEHSALGAYIQQAGAVWMQDTPSALDPRATSQWHMAFAHEMGHVLQGESQVRLGLDVEVPSFSNRVYKRYGYPEHEYHDEYVADLLGAHLGVVSGEESSYHFWRGVSGPTNQYPEFSTRDYRNLNLVLAELEQPQVAIRAAPVTEEDLVLVLYPLAREGKLEPRSEVPEAGADDFIVIRNPKEPSDEPESGAFVDSPSRGDLRRRALRRWLDRLVPPPSSVERGGPGSGHFAHAGRPGERGGSAPGEGGLTGKPYEKLASADLEYHDTGAGFSARDLSALHQAVDESGGGTGKLSGQGGRIAALAYRKAMRHGGGDKEEMLRQSVEDWQEQWAEDYRQGIQTEMQEFVDEHIPANLSHEELRERLDMDPEEWVTMSQEDIQNEVMARFAAQYLNDNYDTSIDTWGEETLEETLDSLVESNAPEPPMDELREEVLESMENAEGGISIPKDEHYLVGYDGDKFAGVAQLTEAPVGSDEHDAEVVNRLSGTPYEIYAYEDFMVLHFLAAAKSGEAYGTKIMRQTFRMAAEQNMGIIGSSVQEAIDFYDKLGVRYTGGERATEGSDMLWTPEGVKETLALLESNQLPADLAPAVKLQQESLAERGGEGSGHFGHEGRPGERGGSQPGEAGFAIQTDLNPADVLKQLGPVAYQGWSTNRDAQELMEGHVGDLERKADMVSIHVTEPDGDIIGFVDVTYLAGEVTIGAMASVEGGRGIGTVLLQEVLKDAATRDARVVGWSLPRAENFWRNAGFTMTQAEGLIRGGGSFVMSAEDVHRAAATVSRTTSEEDEPAALAGPRPADIERGGPGSGNLGHAGRPGQVGGSAPGSGVHEGREGGEEGNVHGFYRLTSEELDAEREKYGVVYGKDKIRSNSEGFVKMAQEGPAPDLRAIKFNATNPSPAFGSEGGGWTEFQFENPEKNVYVQMGEENGIEIATIEALIPGRGGGTEVMHALRDWADLSSGTLSVWRITTPKFFERFGFWTNDKIRDGQSADYAKWDYRRQNGIEERSIVGPRRIVARGGPGSGHYAHAGRPGERGGSAPSKGFSADLVEGGKTTTYTNRQDYSLATMRRMADVPEEHLWVVGSGGHIGLPVTNAGIENDYLDGSAHSVKVSDGALKKIMGAQERGEEPIVIHNHPGIPGTTRDSPPSNNDVALLWNNELLRGFVATPHGWYEMGLSRPVDRTDRETWHQHADIWSEDHPASEAYTNFVATLKPMDPLTAPDLLPKPPPALLDEAWARQDAALQYVSEKMPDLFTYRYTPWAN